MEQEQIKKTLAKSFAGQILETVYIEQGKISRWEKDNDVPVLFVTEDGQSFDHVSTGNIVFPPEFLLSAQASTPEEALRLLVEKEDFIFILMLLKSLTSYGECLSTNKDTLRRFDNRIVILPKEITKSSLEEIQFKIELNRFVVDKYLVNASAIKNLKIGNEFSKGTYPAALEGINFLKFPVNPAYVIIFRALDTINVEDSVIIAVAAGKYLGKRVIRLVEFPPKIEGQDDDFNVVCQESLVITNPFAIAGGFSETFIESKIKLNSFSINLA
jgi:hypothetical protein